jgi:hypothetical protein
MDLFWQTLIAAVDFCCWTSDGLDRMLAFGYTLYNLWRYEYGD